METENIAMLTNAELKERLDMLNEEFEKQKVILAHAYESMEEASRQFAQIKEILNRREGKTNKQTEQ